jgi:hypothetical protein
MPLIRPRPRWDASTPRQALVDEILEELSGSGVATGPVIFEVPRKINDTIHVIVVWPKWEGIPEDDRSAIILDAYAKYEETHPDEDRRKKITVAVGVTPEAAVASDLLPFVVRPYGRGHSSVEQVRQAMIDEGAIVTPSGIELRFPTWQLAEDALHRLDKKKVEGVEHWGLNELL